MVGPSTIKEDSGASAPEFFTIKDLISTVCNVDDNTNKQRILASRELGLPEFLNRPDLGKHKGSLAIVGGGWSVKETLRELDEFRDIMVCGTAHDYLLQEGFNPRYAVICDGNAGLTNYVKARCYKTEYFIASSCPPELFEELGDCDVTTWHTAWAVSDETYKELGIDIRIGGGCTVMLNALPLAILLGYDDLHFFGMDSCKKEKWHSYSQNLIERKEIPIKVVGTDKVFISTPEMVAQAQQFQIMVQNYGDQFKYTIHGEGLIAAMDQHAKTQEL